MGTTKSIQDIRKSYEDIRRLASHMEQLREKERMDIARILHDELGQHLTVLKMDISWLNKKITDKDEKMQQKINDLLSVVDNSVTIVRRISSELYPSVLDDLGLAAALEWYGHDFFKDSGIEINFDTENDDLNLPSAIATGLFRIFQESLTNIIRHAKASTVDVKLKLINDKLVMTVIDNGIGYLPEYIENKKTLGILGMQERTELMNGEYKIISAPGEGVYSEVIVPVSSIT